MRTLDANSTNALAGSRPGDTITVWCWYNGQLAYPDPIPVGQWSMSYDTGRQIQTLDLEVPDSDGTKAPWLLSDPLGVAGSRLQVFYNVGGAGTVAYDWFRISQADPEETWRSYLVTNQGVVNRDTPIPNGKSVRWASGGARTRLKADSLTRNIANAQFLAPSSPAAGSPTVVSEIKRLLTDLMPVTVLSGVTDAAVPSTLVYPQDRLAAVQSLAKRVGADIRTNGSGLLEVYPIANTGTVWTLAPGVEGFQIDVQRTMKLDGLNNVFVADGTGSGSGQRAIRGIARVTGGPLKDGGPHGSYPVFVSSNLIATQADADAYAATMRDTQLDGLLVQMVATCLPHPGLQIGDWITVQAVTTAPAKQVVSFPARVRTIDLRGHDSTVDAMTLGLDASYSDVASVFSGVARG
ncbi:hypothetical protein SPF06_01100 [Sinomonas sp. JGH33]|uniref:Minor tail protein n=1 Tax=Sinomonas terricola TaxID=3110330 RepID=A0ABU5T0Y7_9MICC|nr:hypothetical protein [Sinomonas sp. JGH33]MEA5453308.1 hypothetical protein [Sinomonas sp. JGH33]